MAAQDVIDHSVISAHAQSMKDSQIKKKQMYENVAKVGAGALAAYLIYYGYSIYAYNNLTVPLNVPAELVQEFKQSPGMIKDAIEKYLQDKNSWTNSTFGSAVKLSGSLVLQSMVFQALQPVYGKIQSYFSSKISVPVTRSWFLAEQYQGTPEDAQNKKVEITQELSECIMHIESLEFAYTNHEADLIKDSAQIILSHIIFIKEYETRYIYQRHALQKIYDALADSVQRMADDARNSIFDSSKLEVFKNHIRELRKLPAYSII
jgi:hypothetical protein